MSDLSSLSYWEIGKIKVRNSYLNVILHCRWYSFNKNVNLYNLSICI